MAISQEDQQQNQLEHHSGQEFSNLSSTSFSHTVVRSAGGQRKDIAWWRTQRYILAFLLMTGMINLSIQRINLSIAIICMVNHTAVKDIHDLRKQTNRSFVNLSMQEIDNVRAEGCMVTTLSGEEDRRDGPFAWEKSTQGIILGAVFWANTFMQIPGGHVIRSRNKKIVIIVAQIVNTTMTLCIPEAAMLSVWALFTVRLVQGGCHALTFLSMIAMWTKWAPPRERARLLSIHISGSNLGSICVFPLSARLCESQLWGGWPSVFYVQGMIGIVWIMVFLIFADDSPERHRLISCQERDFLRKSIPELGYTCTKRPPYIAIVTSSAFWGTSFMGFSLHWGLFLILSTLPQYLREVLKMNIHSNGIFSMLPFIALFMVLQVSGPFSDIIINRNWLSKIWTRRLYVALGNLLPAIFLTVVGFLDCTRTVSAVALLTTAMGTAGFTHTAYLLNVFDIAQHRIATVMSLVHTVSTVPGIVVPYVAGVITRDQSRSQWQIVYLITAAVYVAGAAGFLLLGTAELQPWAGPLPVDFQGQGESKQTQCETDCSDVNERHL